MSPLAALPALRRDRSRQVAPQVLEALRELILSLALPPGTVLPRPELAARWGVSQTPVRDALLRLGEEGLVDIFPQHATVVSRIDIPAALQAHFLRRAVELELVRELAGLPAPQADALARALQGHIALQARAQAAQDAAAFMAADRAFHRALYEAASHGELWTLVRRRSGHVDRLRRLNLPARGKMAAVVRDHKAIAAALRAGDAEAAAAAVRAHLAGTLTFVGAVRREHPQWVND